MPILLAILLAVAATNEDIVPKVDAIFAAHAKNDAPGCAVAVARSGQTLLERAYGMANLEYDVPLTPNTIFEAGSVTKQFTSAAILLLEEDGKLSLDDKAIKYIPELDASAASVTIRQLLNHTSGLRDWGTVVDIAGWPRGTRLVRMAHVLDVIRNQRALNFPPGTQFSYSNSGYNLAALIVERVSGKSFPDFTRERIFVPQGMAHSSWRDDYTRVVKGRATAYDPADGGGFSADMDIENIYGNCCLLTTAGDLLKFKPLPRQEAPSTLSNGKAIDYGLGLFLDESSGHRDYYHGGATAGWRAFVTRRPDDDLAVAVLCNRGDTGTAGLSSRVAALFVTPPAPPAVTALPDNATSLAGLYRDPKTNAIFRLSLNAGRLRLGTREGSGAPLTPIDADRYRIRPGSELRFSSDGVHLITIHKPEPVYSRVVEAAPRLADYLGAYRSEEVRATYDVVVEGGQLVAKLAPVRAWKLDPTYPDGFLTPGNDLIHFTRDAAGRVDGFDVKADFSPGEGSARVERLHFAKLH